MSKDKSSKWFNIKNNLLNKYNLTSDDCLEVNITNMDKFYSQVLPRDNEKYRPDYL